MRRLLLTVVAALVFCGVAVAASARGPQYQFDAADQSWSDGVILSAKDVGGDWRSSGVAETITGATSDTASCSAADQSDLVLTAGTYSPDFYRSDGAYVSSSAVVWQTAEQAQTEWERNLQPAIMGCLAAALQGASTKQIKVAVTSRRQVSTWPALAPRSVAYRLALKLTARVKSRGMWHKLSARATSDFLAVGSGRARAMLWTLSFDRQPLSDFSKQHWLMLMAQRTTADPAAAK
jgi:hypothetical protein